MQKIGFLAVAFLFALGSLNAQCKVKQERDEFTGQQKAYTEQIKLTGQNSPSWGKLVFVKVDSFYAMYLHAHTNVVTSVEAGEIFYVKFEDGSVEQFVNKEYVLSDNNYRVLAEMFQGVVVGFDVTPEQLQKLSTTAIAKSRLQTTKKELVFETSPKIASGIMDCVGDFLEAVK